MLARSYTAGLEGVDGYVITVEADARLGLPGLTVVGQACGAVGEARERVRNAIAHCGHDIRPRRQVVNLAPADRRKDSPGIDLAVACALLGSHEVVPPDRLRTMMMWGELSLDGEVRPAAGTLVVADCARRSGFEEIAVPEAAAAEAAVIPGLRVRPIRSLQQLIAHLRGDREVDVFAGTPARSHHQEAADVADVQGQTLARFALEVMVAGGHNLLLHGSPGVGKTMLARRAAGLFPDLEPDHALEVTKIHSVAHHRTAQALAVRPPVRMPHHTISVAGLLGGGTPVRPGEVSLAHRGLLFLDELPEFSRACLEGLREPIEEGAVTIVRASGAVRFPSRFQLMAAMNPCPCGYLGHPDRACKDPITAVQRYQQRLSGPLLDRIDLVVPMHPRRRDEPPETEDASGETTFDVRARIERARVRQRERFVDASFRLNAEIPSDGGAIERYAAMSAGARTLLAELARVRKWSPRSVHRIRRVARTVADLRRPDGACLAPIEEVDLGTAALLRRPWEPVT